MTEHDHELKDLRNIALETQKQVKALFDAFLGNELNPNGILTRLQSLEKQTMANTARIEKIYWTASGLAVLISSLFAIAGLLVSVIK